MKKPILNAVLAAIYIILISTLMFYGDTLSRTEEPSVIMPIGMLSLLTLSVAVMGYLFTATPLQMYIDGNKAEAVKFFLRTLASFAIITLVVFLIIAIGII